MGVLQDLERLILPVAKLNADGVSSASLAILEDGEISAHVITNGIENVDTVYQAASISKPITAVAVARLVDQGRISYDTKVVDYLAQSTVDCIVDSKTSHLMQSVTVGMLLSHTSGLSQHGFDGYAGHPPSLEVILSGIFPANSPRVHFLSFPGAQFSYSGGGFILVQLVLESLTKKSFPDLMQEVVLEPLAMTRSWYGDLRAEEKNFAKAHFTAHTEANTPYHCFPELAAAGLWSTPTDLLKVIMAVQESLQTDWGFLKQETAKKMLKQVAEVSLTSGQSLGWNVNDAIFAHTGGNSPGYQCLFFGFHGGMVNLDEAKNDRRPNKGFAIMTSSQLAFEVAITQIVSAVFYLKGWYGFEKLPSDDDVPYAAPEGTSVNESWKQWLGKWDNDWEIVDKEGPAVTFQTFKPMRLKPAAAPTNCRADGKKDIILVVDGLKTCLKLTWEDEAQAIELIQTESRTLKRT